MGRARSGGKQGTLFFWCFLFVCFFLFCLFVFFFWGGGVITCFLRKTCNRCCFLLWGEGFGGRVKLDLSLLGFLERERNALLSDSLLLSRGVEMCKAQSFAELGFNLPQVGSIVNKKIQARPKLRV